MSRRCEICGEPGASKNLACIVLDGKRYRPRWECQDYEACFERLHLYVSKLGRWNEDKEYRLTDNGRVRLKVWQGRTWSTPPSLKEIKGKSA